MTSLPREEARVRFARVIRNWKLSTLRPVSPEYGELHQRQFSFILLGGYAVCALLTALAIYLGLGYHGLFLLGNHAGANLPSEFWSCLTVFGDTRIALAFLLLFVYRHPQLLSATLLACLPTSLIVQVFKRTAVIPRPSGTLPADAFYQVGDVLKMGSFPSGHSATAGVLFGLLVVIARTRQNKILLLLAMFLVALSRVMVGAHWPVDVLVGSAVGVLSAMWAYRLTEKYQFCQLPISQLAVVSLLLVAAVSIFFTDSGYPQAHLLTMVLASLALTTYSLHFAGIEPDRRWALGRP
jgi:membrane-associated phospholipid phosphatase